MQEFLQVVGPVVLGKVGHRCIQSRSGLLLLLVDLFGFGFCLEIQAKRKGETSG